jgi:hypothetical protein
MTKIDPLGTTKHQKQLLKERLGTLYGACNRRGTC